MKTRNIPLKVNSKLHNQYTEYCEKKGLIVSRQFEIMIKRTTKREGFIMNQKEKLFFDRLEDIFTGVHPINNPAQGK